MKNLLHCLYLLMGAIVIAQETELKSIEQLRGPSYISFDLTTPFNFGTPRYRFGYIQGFKGPWKASLDVSYGSENTSITKFWDIDSENYELVEIRAEAYYIFKATLSVEHYLATELFYIDHTETFIANYYYPEANPDMILRYDRADYRRQKYGIHIKYGALISFAKYFGVNLYYGIGIRTRDTNFNNLLNPRVDSDPQNEFQFFDSLYRNQGNNVGLSMTLGVKFLYKL
ncbi:hypothetical protein [Altibacter sp.]|uniref:hypothetical protein n=1 Tax=Altibacter sp. TaxID=2024823 RepID=UPI002589320F|nr:hypothetical protein [Altibacter sp.]MCW9038541.1 hypothetical protein [Altibacter sp.]